MSKVMFYMVVAATFLLNACSSAPRQTQPLTTADTIAIIAAQKSIAQIPDVSVDKQAEKLPQNIDAAHESFLRATMLDLLGEKKMAADFWIQAAAFDPYNRYLGFKVAEILSQQGNEVQALIQAEQSHKLKGKVLVSQLSLLAHLYVKAGSADSCRKYFKAALDSSRNQDMSLLYDYSLFLEAVKDHKELIHVYDMLLPQVNYIPSLFQRQVNLLLDQNKDSLVIDLFAKAHDATGDKSMLTKVVQGLIFQKRLPEAQAIVDTLTESTADDEAMVILLSTTLAEKDVKSALAFLKKKYYQDKVQTAVLLYHIGNLEYSSDQKDSVKVHLKQALKSLKDTTDYAINTYRILSAIAVQEQKMKEAVRYMEKVDSLTKGNEKNLLAMAYGFAKMYDKAYSLLDSLILAWDNWAPMEGIADAATTEKLKKEAKRNSIRFRKTYANLLNSEAQEIVQKNLGNAKKRQIANSLREKSHNIYISLVGLDSTDMETRTAMAMNLERLGRFDESYAIFEYLLNPSHADKVNRPEILNYYGYTLIDENRSPEDVEKGLQMVILALKAENEPIPSEAYIDSKAWGLYRKGQYAEALELMQQIKSPQFQKDHVYWEHIAAIQEALGMNKEASHSYKRLLKLWPKHPQAERFFKGKKN